MLGCTLPTPAKCKNPLVTCYNKQLKPLRLQYLQFTFSETSNKAYHSFEPWQKYTVTCKGTVALNAQRFLKVDTTGKQKKVSKTQLDENSLLLQNYGDTTLQAVSRNDFREVVFDVIRYSPSFILSYFSKANAPAIERSDSFTVYQTSINKTVVTLYINHFDNLISKIVLLNNHPLYGDVVSTYYYKNYAHIDQLYFPKTIVIEKLNAHFSDEINISNEALLRYVDDVLQKPDTLKWTEEPVRKNEVRVEKYGDHIYFLTVADADARVMLLEFDDYLLLANAPLSSENGELIIKEAKSLFPSKPMRYFVFGHHHPWSIGGIRAFVHKGTQILCVPQNRPYVEYICQAKRTLLPDSLQLQPMSLTMVDINDSTIISDGKLTLKIYVIGKKSDHTNDFLIFYLPNQKMVFEDDLVFISKTGKPKKAGSRQLGLYQAIVDLNLDVNTIVQSWPLIAYGVKTIFPFSELPGPADK